MKKPQTYLSIPSAEFLLRDAIQLLEMSKKIGSKSKKVIDFKKGGAYVRASILLFDSSIEAILNHLIERVAFKELSSPLRERMARLPYKVKLSEVIKHSIKPSKDIKSIKLLIKLEELHRLRNSFVHPQDLKYPVHMSMKKDRKGKELLRLNIHNKQHRFPTSKMHRDFMRVDYRDGKIAKDIAIAFFRWIFKNLTKKDRERLFNLSLVQKGLKQGVGKIDWKVSKEIKMLLHGKGVDLIDFLSFARRKKP